MKTRIQYLDVAKAISILSVVIGHILIAYPNPPFSPIILKIIYTFHVPAFFIFSGILYKETTFLTLIKRKFFALIVPYVFFEMLTCFIKMGLYGSEYININGGIYQLLTLNCSNGPDWFLPTLFIAEIIFYLANKIFDPKFNFIFSLFCICSPYFLTGNHFLIVILRSFIAFGFMYLGFYFKQFFISNYNYKVIISAFFIFTTCAILNEKIDIYSCVIGHPLLYILGATTGTFLLLNICKHIKLSLLTKIIGENTLIILCTHQIYLDILKHFNIHWLVYISTFIIIEPLLIIFFNKFPLLIGKYR